MQVSYRHIFLVSLCLMCFSNVWALSEGVIKSKKANSMDHFLNGYIQHDLGLQEAKIAVAKAELTLEQTNIESGLNVSLSTGNSSVLCNNELSFISHPSLDVSLPTKNNTSVTLSLPTKVVVGSKKTLASVEKAGVSIGRDIFSGKDTRANLAIEKAAHGLIEAKQKVVGKYLELEISFWTEIKNIYVAMQSVEELKASLYAKKTDFESVKAKGYLSHSSKYRIAELEIKEAAYRVQKQQRNLDVLLDNFVVSCGMTGESLDEVPRLTKENLAVNLYDIDDYNSDLYTVLEDSVWNHAYNEKLRAADLKFAVAASVGYGYTGYINDSDAEKRHEISTGLTASYNGLKASVGMNNMLNLFSEPSFTFSILYDFNNTKNSKINTKKLELDRMLEIINIQHAKEAWVQKKQVIKADKSRLEWEREQTQVQLDLYKEVYEDAKKWFAQGVIAEVDFLQAKNSYIVKEISVVLTAIDNIIYNLNVSRLFNGE